MRKPRKPTRSALAKMNDTERCQVLDIMRAELERMRKRGEWSGNPGEMHPVVFLTRMLVDSSSKPELIFGCAKELLPYCEAPKASQMRLDQDNPGTQVIQIVVAPWASDGRERRADITIQRPAIATTATRALSHPANGID